MHFNRYTILIPLFVILASAATFAVHFNWVSYDSGHSISFNISHVFADDGGDGGGDGGGGGDSGGDSGGGGGDSGGDSGGGGGDSGGDSGGTGGSTGGDSGGGDSGTPSPAAPVCTLVANPTATHGDDYSTLTWTTQDATSASIDQGIGAVVVNDSRLVLPRSTTTYTLTASGPGGSVTCSATVVITPPPPPVCTFTVTPTRYVNGSISSIQFVWTSSNASRGIIYEIDKGYDVVPNGSGETHNVPDHTFTYEFDATGQGGTVQCFATVTVTPPPAPPTPPGPPAPICTLTATPSTITKGDSVLLVWTTHNATSASLSGAGPVALNGSGEDHPTSDITYTLTASGPGGTVTCSAPVTVTPPTGPPAPVCTLTATPSTISKGDSVLIVWRTQNATSASLNHGGPVALNGSGEDHPTADITYILTASGPGGTVTCSAPVTVTPPGSPSSPACTLTASPTRVNNGDHTTLTWTTTNAATFSIDQGVGAVTPAIGGNVLSKAITSDTTFTGTATSPTGQVVTCTAAVTIAPSGGGGPACVLTISPGSINSGSSATLSWSGTQIQSVTIDNGIGNVGPSGSTSVGPIGVGNYTYTGTFHATNGQTLTCSAPLQVTGGSGGCTSNCGGGGSTPPNITLLATPSSQPLSYLYLSQIPYTGLDLGPVGTVLYWLALIGWSLALAYLVLFGGFPLLRRKLRVFGERVVEILNTPPAAAAPMAFAAATPEVAPHEVPAEAYAAPAIGEIMQSYSAYDGFKSLAAEGPLTIDDIVKGLSRSPFVASAKQGNQAPVRVAERPEPVAAAASVAPHEALVPPAYQESLVLEQHQAPVAPTPTAPRSAPMAASIPSEVPDFLLALLAGNREVAFGMLREVVRSGASAEDFLTQVACALDDAYRGRLEGIPVHPEIARITAGIATPVLERLVTAFASAVDSSYSVGITGAKLALTRALATLGA